MRNLNFIGAALAPILLLASCATTEPVAPKLAGPVLGRYQFDYAAPERRDVSLIQVFDDGAHTILQFNKLSMPVVITANDSHAPLPFTRQGLYLSIPGVYALLKIETQGHTALILNKARPANLPPSETGSSVGSGPQAQATAPAIVQPIKTLETPVAIPAPRTVTKQSTFIVPFSGNSFAFTRSARALLGDAAPVAVTAQAITLYGRAVKSGTEDLAVAQELALRRAWVIKANLIRHGADPDKFRVFYSGKKGINAVTIDINPAGKKA